MKILLIEDDHEVFKVIELALAAEGIVVDIAQLGEDALDFATTYEYDLIILDLMLPDMDGFKVLQELRSAKVSAPILILSGLGEPERKIKGLGYGADDYLTKPFDIRELLARVKAIVRRSSGHSGNDIVIGNMIISLATHTTVIDGNTVYLTAKEQEVLEYMALKKNTVISKENFLNHLYSGLDEPDMKIIDVFICKMRKKIQAASKGTDYIETVRGRGYLLRDPDAGAVIHY